jgi:hypothetical protein
MLYMSEHEKESVEVTAVSEVPTKSSWYRQRRAKILGIVLVLLLIPLAYAGYVYASTPAAIRQPELDHLHFRMQLTVDGKDVSFAEEKFQQGYAKDQCSAGLANEPFHFHDQRNQIVHVHWRDMSGGQLLKHYGWNLIGGKGNSHGYRINGPTDFQNVPIYGKVLPGVPEGANYYIYVGDENGYQEKSFDDFKSQTFEQFFGKQSNLPRSGDGFSWVLNSFFPKVAAHGDEDHSQPVVETGEDRLSRINNLVGNVVIYVQKDKPTDEQIKDKFNHLEPLSDSTCGG